MVKTSAYTKSGSSPPARRRAWTSPGFHADTRKPDERELVDPRDVAGTKGRWRRGRKARHFVVFVPATRYHPGREDNAWTAERLRWIDEPSAVDLNDSVPTERFTRPPSIDTGTWGLLLAIDIHGEKLSEAMKRMGIKGTAATARTRKRVDRARKVWEKWRSQPRENTTMSQNEGAAPTSEDTHK